MKRDHSFFILALPCLIASVLVWPNSYVAGNILRVGSAWAAISGIWHALNDNDKINNETKPGIAPQADNEEPALQWDGRDLYNEKGQKVEQVLDEQGRPVYDKQGHRITRPIE